MNGLKELSEFSELNELKDLDALHELIVLNNSVELNDWNELYGIALEVMRLLLLVPERGPQGNHINSGSNAAAGLFGNPFGFEMPPEFMFWELER